MSDYINALIRKRRAVFPKSYIQRDIPDGIIQQLLENARWAPTHKMTEPWRFIVFRGNGRKTLGEYLSQRYQATTSEERFSETAFLKMLNHPQKAGCVIAVCMLPDPEARVPEWEEVAAVACAVQNMWLTATAYDLGAYWSTPGVAIHSSDLPGMQTGERCLGLFYVGYYEMPVNEGQRRPIADFARFFEE